MTPAALYVETSALLRILLERDADLLAELAMFSELVTSALTFVEAERGLSRALRERRISAAQRREGQRWLASFARTCETVTLDDRVLDRARAEFPVEPVRTLDALHLATALVWAEALGALTVASCDERVRTNATALGFGILPDHPAVKRPPAIHEKGLQPYRKAPRTRSGR